MKLKYRSIDASTNPEEIGYEYYFREKIINRKVHHKITSTVMRNEKLINSWVYFAHKVINLETKEIIKNLQYS